MTTKGEGVMTKTVTTQMQKAVHLLCGHQSCHTGTQPVVRGQIWLYKPVALKVWTNEPPPDCNTTCNLWFHVNSIVKP